MTGNKYYQDELNYLKEKSGLFIGQMGDDPDVIRLMEGLAFLGGTIRQKLDDEFPELTQGLFSMLWPNYMQPIPGMSILEFQPIQDSVRSVTRICEKEGIPVEVESVSKDGTRCRFRTCYPVDVYPFALENAYLEDNKESQRLRLDFQLFPNAERDKLNVESLRLFFYSGQAESKISRNLYYWFCRDRKITVSVSYDQSNRSNQEELPDAKIVPVSFEEAVLPYPATVFSGYRILQEYFLFPDKFLFVDIKNIGKIKAERFSLIFDVAKDLNESAFQISKDNIRLYCTPIINIFNCPGRPFRLDHKKIEYPIDPLQDKLNHYHVYSIVSVKGHIYQKGGKGKLLSEREYRPFSTFNDDFQTDSSMVPAYQVSLRTSDGRSSKAQSNDGHFGPDIDSYLRFTTLPSVDNLESEETISLDLLCTNRHLPSKIKVGEITESNDHSPGLMKFKNITPVTQPVSPPQEKDFNWRLLSNLTLNYGSLSENVEALRYILQVHDFAARYNKSAEHRLNNLLSSIVGIKTERLEDLIRGIPTNSLKTTVMIRKQHFNCEGDLFLFGSVLNSFFSLYAHVNSFHQTKLIIEETQKEYIWKATTGKQPLL